jgi:small subunit ribosomal protein S6
LKTMAKNKLYEGMFLVDSAEAGSDWDGVMAAIKKTLERAEAEIVSMRKWDDRRLAYEIRGKARGTYILCYFRADGEKIGDIEKAVQLSEKLMRVLILNAERLTAEDIEKDTPATKTEKERDKRKTDKEAHREAEKEQPGIQKEEQATEEAEQDEKTKQALDEQAEQGEKTKQAPDEQTGQDEKTEQAPDEQAAQDEKTKQALDEQTGQDEKTEQAPDEQEAEDLQESEPNALADD